MACSSEDGTRRSLRPGSLLKLRGAELHQPAGADVTICMIAATSC